MYLGRLQVLPGPYGGVTQDRTDVVYLDEL
jgi:hypothetical protein